VGADAVALEDAELARGEPRDAEATVDELASFGFAESRRSAAVGLSTCAAISGDQNLSFWLCRESSFA